MGGSGGDGVRWNRETIIQIDRLMVLECFVCKETDLEVNAFFNRKPVE